MLQKLIRMENERRGLSTSKLWGEDHSMTDFDN